MILSPLFALFPLVAALVLIQAGFSDAVAARRSDMPTSARSARRRSALLLVAGIILSIPVGYYLLSWDDFGRGVVMLVPGVITCLAIGLALSAVSIDQIDRDSREREASLVSRSLRSVVPPRFAVASLVGLVLAVGGLIATTLTASADSISNEMRVFSISHGDTGRTFSPYPGAFYSIPLILTIALVLALALACMKGAQRWGAVDTGVYDMALRSRIATRGVACAAATCAIGIFVAGLSLHKAAGAVASVGDPSWGWKAAGILAVGMAIYGGVLGLWAIVRFVAPQKPVLL
ncbi:hypothetical protein BFN03_12505 [Rhodococcus sp. WMMA185]|uniref:hypothetical protein n=1 Tax=Rhodococcus sp. WMMA185 TaxID=679318 RepID=UPI0008785CF1|nr:hypothetical protein [Rhodococcus sp. WMMA185]AOW93187.1 hypothetical protein BFN03_12505 [Rhodococcus sp. WMMA185]